MKELIFPYIKSSMNYNNESWDCHEEISETKWDNRNRTMYVKCC